MQGSFLFSGYELLRASLQKFNRTNVPNILKYQGHGVIINNQKTDYKSDYN